MVKAFIFDMDGVLINSEATWYKYESKFVVNLFGKEISDKIGDTVGVSLKEIYSKAVNAGFNKPLEEVEIFWDQTAFKVYDNSQITPNTDDLMKFLIENSFRLGLVSSSKISWINMVLPRLKYSDQVEVLSLDEGSNSNLRPKPSSDGYKEMMKRLGSNSISTIILEDSNTGIKSAMDSGAYTISISQNLISGYNQIQTANAKVKNMREVIEIVKKWTEVKVTN